MAVEEEKVGGKEGTPVTSIQVLTSIVSVPRAYSSVFQPCEMTTTYT